jgi:hypothetical protein
LSTLTVTPSAPAQAGDLILIGVATSPASTSGYSNTAISGFTSRAIVNRGSGQWQQLQVFRKVATANEPSSYVVSFSGPTSDQAAIALMTLSGVHATQPTATATFNDTSRNTAISIPALSIANANSWDVVLVAAGGDDRSRGNGGDWLSNWGAQLVERVDRDADYAGIGIATSQRSVGTQAATSVTGVGSDTALAIRIEVRSQ